MNKKKLFENYFNWDTIIYLKYRNKKRTNN